MMIVAISVFIMAVFLIGMNLSQQPAPDEQRERPIHAGPGDPPTATSKSGDYVLRLEVVVMTKDLL